MSAVRHTVWCSEDHTALRCSCLVAVVPLAAAAVPLAAVALVQVAGQPAKVELIEDDGCRLHVLSLQLCEARALQRALTEALWSVDPDDVAEAPVVEHDGLRASRTAADGPGDKV